MCSKNIINIPAPQMSLLFLYFWFHWLFVHFYQNIKKWDSYK